MADAADGIVSVAMNAAPRKSRRDGIMPVLCVGGVHGTSAVVASRIAVSMLAVRVGSDASRVGPRVASASERRGARNLPTPDDTSKRAHSYIQVAEIFTVK